MNALILALMLQEPPEVVPVPAEFGTHAHSLIDVRAGVGVLLLDGFQADTPLGTREIESDPLALASLELGLDWEGWGISLGGAVAGTGDVQARLGWLRLATPALLELPVALRVSAGPVAGTLDIDASGFGDFEPGLGFLARVSLETRRESPLTLALWVDALALEFDYDEPTLSGDKGVGSFGLAVGLSAGLRF
ncbi:MAG TPA: hypothetical protein VF950_29880 [Planctomycetota bacterium]